MTLLKASREVVEDLARYSHERVENPSDGVALFSIPHPPGLIEKMAEFAMNTHLYAGYRLHFDEKTLEPIVTAILADTSDPTNQPENPR